MQYEELHSRFGPHTANKVVAELTPSEFGSIPIDNLAHYLELRAERAHNEYLFWISQGLFIHAASSALAPDINMLHKFWSDAEDLSYLVAVAEDVAVHFLRSV